MKRDQDVGPRGLGENGIESCLGVLGRDCERYVYTVCRQSAHCRLEKGSKFYAKYLLRLP